VQEPLGFRLSDLFEEAGLVQAVGHGRCVSALCDGDGGPRRADSEVFLGNLGGKRQDESDDEDYEN